MRIPQIKKCLFALLILFCAGSVPCYAAESQGIHVNYHTQEEIRQYLKAKKININEATEYSKAASLTAPYSPGEVNADSLQDALDMMNAIRYIAGIDDNLTLDSRYTQMAQAAALVNASNGTLSHFPQRPAGMDDELYQAGKDGAGSSNLAWASWKAGLNELLVYSWMEDGDSSNIDRVGHRRWILNPSMQKTGFGWVYGSKGTFAAMYAFDNSFGATPYYGVTWPAQNMPIEYFDSHFPWSISMGKIIDASNVKVALTRTRDGKTWIFSNGSATDGYFNVENSNYGKPGCIIFRPNDIVYQAGDQFKVEITGLDETVSWQVNFFSSGEYAIQSVQPTQSEYTYNGSQKKPSVIVKDSSGKSVSNIYYNISYENNVNAGTATVTVNGTGKYKGSSASATFKIKPCPISQMKHLFGLNQKSYTYDGKAKEPKVSAAGLTEGHDYTVAYLNNKDAGQAQAKITGIKNYTGTFSLTFTIQKAEPDASGTKAGTSFTDTASNAKYKVTASGKVEYTAPSNKKASSVKIPSKVTYDGKSYSVASVGANAFKNNKSLKKISIPKSVKTIGKNAFYGCSSLKTISGCSGVVTIGAKAFYGCKGLKTVNLTSAALKTIGDSAFQGCTAMVSFTSKSTKLTKVGKKAFYGDKKLAKISLKTSKLKKASIGSNAFKGIKKACKFKVPKAKTKSYKTIFRSKGAGSKCTVSKL